MWWSPFARIVSRKVRPMKTPGWLTKQAMTISLNSILFPYISSPPLFPLVATAISMLLFHKMMMEVITLMHWKPVSCFFFSSLACCFIHWQLRKFKAWWSMIVFHIQNTPTKWSKWSRISLSKWDNIYQLRDRYRGKQLSYGNNILTNISQIVLMLF